MGGRAFLQKVKRNNLFLHKCNKIIENKFKIPYFKVFKDKQPTTNNSQLLI